ncbi:uncharacterized protein [Palaemon carinicauda]|uniref:uncharacterized protein isoform X2 n=1 Tax=Palaemon carinicauda TaxID=392227 RepID=UPI0035B5A345
MSNQQMASSVTELTICSRVYLTALTSLSVLLSYASADIYDNAIMMYLRDGVHYFRYNNKPQSAIEEITVSTVLRNWRHYCHVISGETYSFYIDGVKYVDSKLQVDDRVLPLNGTFVIGQEQDGLDRRYNRFQILKGYVAQFNLWSYGLDSKSIRDMATCKQDLQGNVVSSDRDAMDLINADVRLFPIEEFCSQKEKFLIFPELYTFFQASEICKLMGSVLYIPTTLAGNNELVNISRNYGYCQSISISMWLGATDNQEEGVWRKISNEEVLKVTNFKQGQPDNIKSENCLASDRDGFWADYNCIDPNQGCAPCEEHLQTPLFLRGLCFNLKTESMVEIIGYSQDGKPYFHGYYGMVIYKATPEQWALFDTVTNKTMANLNMSSESLYPIGKHSWTITDSICDVSIGTQIELSLSACGDEKYMCNNGECIDLKSRCDAKDDCSDESDEDNCAILRIPEDYRSFKPPKNILNSSLPLQPLLKIEFLRFLSIEDVKESIQIEFMIQLSWPDSRIKYMNLRDDTLANQLAEGEINEIWRPSTNFPNIKDGALKLLGENLYVLKVKNSLIADFNAVNMDEIYGGDAAMIVQQQHYSGSFVCTFDVFYYPFDEQECSILVQFSSVSKELVAFTTNGSSTAYGQSAKLPIYIVSDFFALVPSNETRLSMVQVGFMLTRRYTLIVLSIYLPSLMLLAIGYATLFVEVRFLEVRLQVALTTLLVLYTFFNQTSSSLPQTAYVKLIDMWFFFCTIFLFIIILIHVFAEKFGKNKVISVGSGNGNMGFGKVAPGMILKIKNMMSSGDQFLVTVRTIIGPTVLIIFFFAYLFVILT